MRFLAATAKWCRRGSQDVFFVDEKTGWVAGDKGTVLYTRDGGGVWEAKSVEAASTALNDVLFVGAKRGFIIGNAGRVFYTANGGDSWTALKGMLRTHLFGLAYGGKEYVIVVGATGTVLKYGFPAP